MGIWLINNTVTISPGATLRCSYWWGSPGQPKGPMIASVGPIQDPVTQSNLVEVTQQGFVLNENGCTYTVDFTCEDVIGGDEFGECEIWAQSVWPAE